MSEANGNQISGRPPPACIVRRDVSQPTCHPSQRRVFLDLQTSNEPKTPVADMHAIRDIYRRNWRIFERTPKEQVASGLGGTTTPS